MKRYILTVMKTEIAATDSDDDVMEFLACRETVEELRKVFRRHALHHRVRCLDANDSVTHQCVDAPKDSPLRGTGSLYAATTAHFPSILSEV